VGRCDRPDRYRALEQHPQGLSGRGHREGEGIGVQASWEFEPRARDAVQRQVLGQGLGGAIAGLVGIVGDHHPRDPEALDCREMLGGEALDAVARRHAPIASRPKRQRVQQRLAEDDLRRAGERLDVEDAAQGTRQVEMARHPGARMVREPPPVQLDDLTGLVRDRDHERPVEVLVPARPQQAELFEAAPQRGPGLAIARRQAVAERAVGEAQLEVVDQLGHAQAAVLEIAQRLGTGLERRVVVGHHVLEQLVVGRVALDRRGQPRHRRALHAAGRRGGGDRGRIGAQQLDSVPEAQPLGLHHPVDHRAAPLAGPETVLEVLRRRDHQRGRVIVVEGTAPDQIGAVAGQGDAPGLGERGHRHLALQPFDLRLRNSRQPHRPPPPCQGQCGRNNSGWILLLRGVESSTK
jgi:hypothetical protein